jgi:hypothetical protein
MGHSGRQLAAKLTAPFSASHWNQCQKQESSSAMNSISDRSSLHASAPRSSFSDIPQGMKVAVLHLVSSSCKPALGSINSTDRHTWQGGT